VINIDIEKKEEKRIKNVILLSSTFLVMIVAIIIAYILISSEIHGFQNHLKTYEETLIQREKTTIKSAVDNIISDIKFDENSRLLQIKRTVKNQTTITVELLRQILENTTKNKKQTVIDTIKEISLNKDSHFFIYKDDGTLLFKSNDSLTVGKNYIDLEDIDGKKFVQKIVEENGFIDYNWFVPNNYKISKKITYSMKIEELGIIIGSAAFLNKNHSLNKKILDKIYKEKLSNNNFIFIYDIMSLSSSKNYSKLILENNIETNKKELLAVENILEKSSYKGNIFYEYDNKLIYSSFLFDDRTFISVGINLDSIKSILDKEREIAYVNLNKKIISLILNMILVSFIFFIFSYFMSKKIERMFKRYHKSITNSQQLLIQKTKMASMGEMIANIAHQWRQPLSNISGIFLDIESAYNYKDLNKKYLTNRINQANDLLEYMSKTIDDFKEFYTPNTTEEIFTFYSSVKHAISLSQASLSYYNIGVEVNIDKSLKVAGSSSEFSQVILNILSNTKEIAFQREIKQPHIKIYSKVADENIFIHIHDNCGGIQIDNIDKIFEPYYTTKYGSGIGLYMSKIIIERKFNGKMYAKNTKKGNFRMTIKIKDSDLESDININR